MSWWHCAPIFYYDTFVGIVRGERSLYTLHSASSFVGQLAASSSSLPSPSPPPALHVPAAVATESQLPGRYSSIVKPANILKEIVGGACSL